MQMDSGEWDEMLNARRGAGQRQRERAPLPPDASEVERYVIRCKHIGEAGRDFLTPIAEAQELCARYGAELIPREKWAPGRRAKE